MTRVSPGSTTTDPASRANRLCRHRHHFHWPHRIEQFGARDEHHAGAQQRHHHTQIAGIDFDEMAPALDRADGDCIDDEECLEPGLDDEQSGEAFQHGYG
jgi:hypothetical protein